jgi:hypothetical protein
MAYSPSLVYCYFIFTTPSIKVNAPFFYPILNLHKIFYSTIPPEQNGSFVANMEMVLDVYKRPLDPLYPVVCMDESPKQLIAETKVPIPASTRKVAKHDYEYKRAACAMFSLPVYIED